LDLKKMGLEMDVLPVHLYLRYQQTFPEYEWVDVSSSLLRLRMIKTPYEVDQIRRAARILHTGSMEIKEIIREGMAELEIDGHLALIARREGHMGILRMRGWNQEMTYAHVLSGDSGAPPLFSIALTVDKAIRRPWHRAQVFARSERMNQLEMITALASMAMLPISFGLW
jgi:Xaa-Pro aminopeptidase